MPLSPTLSHKWERGQSCAVIKPYTACLPSPVDGRGAGGEGKTLAITKNNTHRSPDAIREARHSVPGLHPGYVWPRGRNTAHESKYPAPHPALRVVRKHEDRA